MKGSTAQLTCAAPSVVRRPAAPPTSYVDPDNFQGAVQALYRARAQLLNAADLADFAARKAGTPIRTQTVRANIDLLCAEISRIEQQVMLAAAAELGQGSGGAKDLLRRVAGISGGKQVDLEFDEEHGTEFSLRKPANDRRKVGELSDRFGHQSLVRTLRDNVRKAKGFDQKGLDLAFTALRSGPAMTKKSPSTPAATKPKSPTELPTGKGARELVLVTSPAELSKRFSADQLAKLLAEITSLGSFSITKTDLRAIATILDALKVEGIKSSDATRILDAFGADNMETLLSNIRSRMLLDQSYFSPQDRELASKVLVDFSLLVRQALEAPGYYENEHVLDVFLRENPITVSILLLEPSAPPPSSKLLALLAGRILVDPGALQIINVNYAPGRTARMLLLDALEKDQKAGGDAVERYLFDRPNVSPWSGDDVRQNTLLISHKRPSVGNTRGDENDERTADLFLAAVIARFQTNKHDVLTLFKTAVEGKFSDHGARYSEEGQFTMAHILSMLMNEQSVLPSTFKQKSSYLREFENFISGKGQQWFGDISYQDFGKFVGSIGQSDLGGAELMASLAHYLRSKGAQALINEPALAGGLIGTMIDFVRDESRDRIAKGKQLLDFLLGASVAVGVAAYGPVLLAGALSKQAIAGVVEMAKSTAKYTAKVGSDFLVSGLKSAESLEADMQMLFALNIFPALPGSTKVAMNADKYLQQFINSGLDIKDWTIEMPKVGSQFFDGTATRTFLATDIKVFMGYVSRFVPPTYGPVVLFSNSLFLRMRGE